MNKHTGHIAVITDSGCDIPPDLIEEYQIIIVPLYVLWGQEGLRDGVDIDASAFYTRLQADPVHPTTSQPTPSDFARAIRESEAREAVIITLSAKLSGTFDSAHGAREMVNMPVHVVDSRSVSMGMGWQVLAAARTRDQGGGAKEIVAAAQRVREKISTLFTVDTLEYLHKGGRIGGATKLLGSALQLKPMLVVDNVTGLIDVAERIRTRVKAIRRIVEATFERCDPGKPMRAAIIHAAAPDDAQCLLEEVRARCHAVELTLGWLTPALGVHGGPGLIGLCAYND